jgi:transcriptional regulator with XRE-family HTH domain
LKVTRTIVPDATVTRPEAEIFGKRLRTLREAKGLSQEDLANTVADHGGRLTGKYVSDLERGLKAPTLTMILKLSKALEAPVAELLEDFTPGVVRRLRLE